MIIGFPELFRRVEQEGLVEGLAERELQTPEGVGFDLRAWELRRMKAGQMGRLGVELRSTPDYVLEEPVDPGTGIPEWDLGPHGFWLVTTKEKVNTPLDLVPIIWPRTTTFRDGLVLTVGTVQPGYHGTLTFGLANHGNAHIILERGARIVQVLFMRIDGMASTYRGQWQEGRVYQPYSEKQV